jgi:hypothetical protein
MVPTLKRTAGWHLTNLSLSSLIADITNGIRGQDPFAAAGEAVQSD